MSSTAAVRSTFGRPLVVLAGWLGCQPKSLKRYEQLYRDCGFQIVVSRIATPAMIVNALLHPHKNAFEVKPPTWPSNTTPVIQSGSMTSLAWDVLRDIHQANCSFVLFHSFSNGGFFLWEHVRQILAISSIDDLSALNKDSNQRNIHSVRKELAIINSKLAGLVFDSCPSANMTLLPQAMQYASWREKLDTVRCCGTEYIFLSLRPTVRERIQEQASNFLNVLQYSSNSTPHLFLYSEDDHLIDSIVVDDIVQHRTALVGSEITFSKRWASSVHCSHFREHPDGYRAAVKEFVDVCFQLQEKKSKL